MSVKLEWNGRPVVVGEFDIRQGKAVRAAFSDDAENGSYLCLAVSLRYADSNELVFGSTDEIWSQPFRLQQRILRLAGQAAKVNGLIDDDADGADGERITNGSGERAGPSL